MTAKKKSHGILFTPYLEKGEDLLWVGIPMKTKYIHFHSEKSFEQKMNFIFWGWFFLAYPLFALWSVWRQVFDVSLRLHFSVSYCFGILFFPAFFVFLTQIYFGKIYYAITTKRLLILRRHLWSSVDAELLMILPEHKLELNKYKTASIVFDLLRLDENYHPESRSKSAHFTYTEVRRANLENLSHEDAQIANELLTAMKNDMLEDRARELGLMD